MLSCAVYTSVTSASLAIHFAIKVSMKLWDDGTCKKSIQYITWCNSNH